MTEEELRVLRKGKQMTEYSRKEGSEKYRSQLLRRSDESDHCLVLPSYPLTFWLMFSIVASRNCGGPSTTVDKDEARRESAVRGDGACLQEQATHRYASPFPQVESKAY